MTGRLHSPSYELHKIVCEVLVLFLNLGFLSTHKRNWCIVMLMMYIYSDAFQYLIIFFFFLRDINLKKNLLPKQF